MNQQLKVAQSFSKKDSIIIAVALFPLLISGAVVFGSSVFLIALVSYSAMFVVEYIFQRIRKKPLGYTILFLPLIFTLLLPPTLPLWIVFVGAFFISFFGKGIFGGDAHYVIHPVIAGILFITISFPTFLNANWIDPNTLETTTLTPMIAFNNGSLTDGIWSLLNGFSVGTVGETSRLLIVLIGIVLVVLKVVDYKIILSYLGSILLFTYLFHLVTNSTDTNLYLSLLVGNVLFVSVFVATDLPTIPLQMRGRILYGVGLGLITVLIRMFSAFPEGSLFAIIIMNAVSPLLDQGGEQHE